jgi:hypothetical protein
MCLQCRGSWQEPQNFVQLLQCYLRDAELEMRAAEEPAEVRSRRKKAQGLGPRAHRGAGGAGAREGGEVVLVLAPLSHVLGGQGDAPVGEGEPEAPLDLPHDAPYVQHLAVETNYRAS